MLKICTVNHKIMLIDAIKISILLDEQWNIKIWILNTTLEYYLISEKAFLSFHTKINKLKI